MSLTPLASTLGKSVPLPDDVAVTANVVLVKDVTVQLTPVAVPVLPISAEVNELRSIGSLNATEKVIGKELVSAG
jgi:hypothetical protein